MAEFKLDTRELRVLEKDLTAIPAQLSRHVIPILKRGAVQIKHQLIEEMKASKHFKGFAAISFDIEAEPGSNIYRAVIGPEKGGPGSGANIAYFGTSRGGGTVPDPMGALEAETPNFSKALAKLAGDLL